MSKKAQAQEDEEDGVSDLIRNAAQAFMDKGEIPEDMLNGI